MLESIYRVGVIRKLERNDISYLLTPTPVDRVIVIIFKSNIGSTKMKIKYSKTLVEDFKRPQYYLYRRDYSGTPGLFLTGNISKEDINDLKNAINENKRPTNSNNAIVQKFIKNKILWFPNGKLVHDRLLTESLDQNTKSELLGILKKFNKRPEEIAKRPGRIATDVLKCIKNGPSEQVFLTIGIERQTKSGKRTVKYIGQINAYKRLFKKGILWKKYDDNENPKHNELIICTICHNKRIIETYRETPVPFYITDKPMFFPNADEFQSRKGFPLCDDCYLDLQKGIQFIRDKLHYRIPALSLSKKGKINKGNGLNFWLIPHLNDEQLLLNLEVELITNKTLYINVLKELCSNLSVISKADHHERRTVRSFLRFSALFYNYDEHGIMRVSNYIQDIYPRQLEKLLDVKNRVDRGFPFSTMSKMFKEEFVFGFPLDQLIECNEAFQTGLESN